MKWTFGLLGALCLSPLASCARPEPTSAQPEKEKTKVLTNQEAWKIYERYLEGWKGVSDEQRAKIVAELTSADLRYATRLHESGGRGEATADMAAFQAKFPGGHFEVGDVAAHHDVALLTWVLVEANGNVFARGHDQLQVSPDGKITSILTFPPPASSP